MTGERLPTWIVRDSSSTWFTVWGAACGGTGADAMNTGRAWSLGSNAAASCCAVL